MNDALGFRRRFVLVDLGTVPTVVVNGSAPMLVLLIAALQFFAFPLVPPTRSVAVSLVALAVLSAPLHWRSDALDYSRLVSPRRWNRLVGRALGVLIGLS
jgi:hypothetical protein